MTRKIKFRAWVKEKKQMINDLQGWSKGYQEKYELMQFTGLKDKNGKEIYEEDIVEYGKSKSFKGHRILIRFSEGRFAGWNVQDLENEYPLDRQLWHICDRSKPEVIGNKWENKELLK